MKIKIRNKELKRRFDRRLVSMGIELHVLSFYLSIHITSLHSWCLTSLFTFSLLLTVYWLFLFLFLLLFSLVFVSIFFHHYSLIFTRFLFSFTNYISLGNTFISLEISLQFYIFFTLFSFLWFYLQEFYEIIWNLENCVD